MIARTRFTNTVTLQVAVVASLLIASAGYAAGTTSDTDIDNTAVVTYDLSGTPQTLIESSPTGNSVPGATNGSPTTFKVDNLIDFTVTEADAAYTAVSPNSTNMAVSFTLQNDGNTVQDFSLAAFDLATSDPDPFGGTDNFNATIVGIFVESGGGPGYQDGVDTATYVDELAEDDAIMVYVVRDIGAQADLDVSGVILAAQVAQGGTSAALGADITSDDRAVADDPATVQIVFNDGVGDEAGDPGADGRHSDTDAFIVRTATLQITKASQVISDPFSPTDPKAIPGAVVRYTITVDNTAGSGTATNVTITDDLSTEIGLGTIAFNTDTYGADQGMRVTAANINGGAPTPLTNVAADDQGTWNSGTSNLTVNGIDVDPGDTAVFTYEVTIQ